MRAQRNAKGDAVATRRLQIGCEFNHVAQWETPARFILRPARETTFHDEVWHTDPGLDVHVFTDVHGNETHRTVLPVGQSLFSYYAIADVPDEVDFADEDAPQLPPQDLPDETLLYTVPSRFCQSDQLSAAAWDAFGHLEPGYRRVDQVMDFVWKHLEYRTGSTGSWWTAADSYQSGFGVCRDFAHLMISFCRALNLPARYVFGYLPDLDVPPLPTPMDFHAWVEVYLGDRWFVFDPRHNERRKGRIPIGRGRDAADVAMVTTFGAPWLRRMTVWCEELADGVEWPPTDRSFAARNPFAS